MPQRWTVSDQHTRDALIQHIDMLRLSGKRITIEFVPDHITQKQINSLNLWCGQVAEYLNSCGLDQRAVLKEDVSIDWTKESAKTYLYKPILEAMTGKTSTMQQDTVEPSKVADTIARHFGEKFGITLPPWPHR